MAKNNPNHIILVSEAILAIYDKTDAEDARIGEVQASDEAEIVKLVQSGEFEDKAVLDRLVFHRNRSELIPHKRVALAKVKEEQLGIAQGVYGAVNTLNAGLVSAATRHERQLLSDAMKSHFPGGAVPQDEVMTHVLQHTTLGLRLASVNQQGGWGSADGYVGALRTAVESFWRILETLAAHKVPIPAEHQAVWEAHQKG